MFASGLLLPPVLYVHVHLYAFMVICSEEFSLFLLGSFFF